MPLSLRGKVSFGEGDTVRLVVLTQVFHTHVQCVVPGVVVFVYVWCHGVVKNLNPPRLYNPFTAVFLSVIRSDVSPKRKCSLKRGYAVPFQRQRIVASAFPSYRARR